MAIGRGSLAKSLAQSTISAASLLFVHPATETLLMGAGAYIAALRGAGWSPTLEVEAQCAARCLPRDQQSVVIDAGANVGDWLKAIRSLVHPGTQFYAFEPQPAAAAQIRQLSISNCEVLEMALGEHAETGRFFTAHESDSMASLFERHDTVAITKEYRSFEVPIIRLDDFVSERNLGRIDFMKMDLEGGELQALKGAKTCMESGVLRAFSFEFGTSNVNSRVFFRDIFDFLTQYEYKIHRITPARRLIPVQGYSEDLECFARTSTFLAHRSECSPSSG